MRDARGYFREVSGLARRVRRLPPEEVARATAAMNARGRALDARFRQRLAGKRRGNGDGRAR